MCRARHAMAARCGSWHTRPHHSWEPFEHHHYPGHGFSGGLGVRRPLRFLAWKLGLDEAQVASLAAILNELKTERAQAEVDDRRALTSLAEAVQAETFDSAMAAEAADLRVQSAGRVQRKVADSVQKIHNLLNPEQRAKLAYLLRTGALLM